MSIYNFDLKGMRKAFKDFSHTVYGKTVFVIAYLIPTILFFAGIALVIISFVKEMPELLTYGIVFLIMFVAMFLLANAYYYAEVRHFCEKRKIAVPAKKSSKKVVKKAAKKTSKKK